PIVDDAGFEDALTMIFGQSEQPKEPSDQESEGGARDSREGGHRESESGEWDSREGNSRQSEGGERDSEKRDDAFTKTYEEPYKISPERDPLLSILSQKPCIPERLIGVCGENVVEVIRCLSSLELAGAVVRLRDGRYAPTGF
ncbi:MAG: hypothetical protein LBI64_04860, partial [Coriobacteriales bacterium]|nr:hypothetical protein [Coriobacteriales bacterium]